MKIPFTLLALLFYLLCYGQPTVSNTPYNVAPPGTVKIGDNRYFDQTEVTNRMYVEYLAWLNHVYEKSSKHYQQALPDTSVWTDLGAGYSSLQKGYLRYPKFSQYPVVGLSYQQAKAYASWRSDRVMQVILVRHKVIPLVRASSPDSIFTIKKYYTGNYRGIIPDKKFMFYPQYELPYYQIYQEVYLKVDSINARGSRSCRLLYRKLISSTNCYNKGPIFNDEKPYGPRPTRQTSYDSDCRDYFITGLRGNLREMTKVKGVFYGRSFKDRCNLTEDIVRRGSAKPNAYTGFRTICHYHKWAFSKTR